MLQASARFEHKSTRDKFVAELAKILSHALLTNNGRLNFDVFRNTLIRYEYDCKRHAINKVIQSHSRDTKYKTDEIEHYYSDHRYKNFLNQETFKFKTPDNIAAINRMSVDVARRTVVLCANMEAISARLAPNIH